MTKIRMIMFDVDGTLTDGKINMSANGELFKAFNVKDGYRIIDLKNHGIIPAIITGRRSEIVERRAKELKIEEIYQNISNKIEIYELLREKYGLEDAEIAYMGDDLNDLDCIKKCGLAGCPSDAVEELKDYCDFVAQRRGGDGAAREFLDRIIEQNRVVGN